MARMPGLLPHVLFVLLTAFVPAETAAAESPLDASVPLMFLSDEPSLLSDAEAITQTGPINEGHTTLIWREAPQAEGYRIVDDAGHVFYEGRFTKAFISGLPDGEHTFRVIAVDRFGQVMGTGPEPLVVTVRHWDLKLAWGLFGLGAAVMASLVAVLCLGTVRGIEPPRTSAGDAGNVGTETPVQASETTPGPSAPASRSKNNNAEGAPKPADQNGGTA